jgi:tetratricopeptide (TPR) repeat protein
MTLSSMLIALTAAQAAASASAAAPVPPAPVSAQAQFDIATTALNADQCDLAVATFQALEGRAAVRKNTAVMGSIAVRKGKCLYKMGRADDAQAALLAGLPMLPADDDAYRDDRFTALLTLGMIAVDALDYKVAADHFTSALAQAQAPIDKASANIWLARTTLFETDDRAIGYADAAL